MVWHLSLGIQSISARRHRLRSQVVLRERSSRMTSDHLVVVHAHVVIISGAMDGDQATLSSPSDRAGDCGSTHHEGLLHRGVEGLTRVAEHCGLREIHGGHTAEK